MNYPEKASKGDAGPPLETFRILVVCTGNICRSPLAEVVLQAGMDEVAPGSFAVTSAGTHAHHGKAAQTGSRDLAAGIGASLKSFRARQLTPEHILSADLVLILAAVHRPEVLSLVPSALKRTFTLREFARILQHMPLGEYVGGSWVDVVATAHTFRHHAATDDPALDDVTDPYGLGPDAYELMAAELLPGISTIIEAGVILQRKSSIPG